MLRPIVLVLVVLAGPAVAASEPFTVKVLSCHDGDTCSTLERRSCPIVTESDSPMPTPGDRRPMPGGD